MRIVTILCWLVAAAALTGLALWFLTGSVFGVGAGRWGFSGWRNGWSFGSSISSWEALTGPYEPVGTYNVGLGTVDSISIDWTAGNVRIEPHDGPDIRFTEFAQRQLRDDEKLRFDINGSTLTIKFRERGIIGSMPSKRLEVLVPRELSDKLKLLSAETASGDIYIDSFEATTLNAESLSGGVQISNITARSFDANSTSGSINITSVWADVIGIESLSGTVRVSETSAGILKGETTSGNINVSGAFVSATLKSLSGRVTLDNAAPGSRLTAETTSGTLDLTGSFESVDSSSLSGGITVRSSSVPSSLKASSTSGGVTVAIPDAGAINVYQSTTSGRFSSDIPVTLQSRSGAQFELSTLSGNIRIQVYR